MAGEPPLLRVRNAVVESFPQAARSWSIRLVALIAFLAVWLLITSLHLVDEKFLPPPSDVWDAAVRALPPLGYIGLLIVWFGIGDTSKVWLLFLAAFPAVAISTLNGVHSVNPDQINAARALGANRLQVQTGVVVPATLPEVINGIRIAVGFAWTTVVAAELNNGIPGIGGLAYLAGQQLDTSLTIACIVVIGITALALDAVIKQIGVLLIPWKGKA